MFEYYFTENGLEINPRVRPEKIIIREPRPVFHEEMRFYRLEDYFDFEDSDAPYFWAESTTWFYRGRKIGRVPRSDSGFEADKFIKDPDFNDKTLYPVDLAEMNRRNEEGLNALRSETIGRFLDRYDDNILYYVSFSGGKDSVASMEIIEEAIPGKYVVVFGDTQMEFPQTYEYVEEIQKLCESRGVPFYRAKSDLEVFDSWRKFGPPSRKLRWCCSVHKSTPVALLTKRLGRERGKKTEAVVGVRHSESLMRRDRPLETNSFDSKVLGEKIFNILIDWTSGEVWAYLFSRKAPINKAYRVGFRRVGCLVCPMAGNR